MLKIIHPPSNSGLLTPMQHGCFAAKLNDLSLFGQYPEGRATGLGLLQGFKAPVDVDRL